MIKLVIIDFDDTLSLTEKACFNIENHIAKKMGFLPMDRDTHLKNWGKPIKEAIKERFPGINVNNFMVNLERTLPEFVKRSKIDVVSNVNLEVLDILKKLGYKLAILTSRTLGEVKHLINKNHPLNTRIETIYHRNNMKYVKPDPRVFKNALSEYDVKPNEAIYIGDSPSDALAAKNAGLHFIALLESKIRTRTDFVELKVDFFADTFPQIIDYIRNN